MNSQEVKKYTIEVLKQGFPNKKTLDKLSTSNSGNLLFDGKEIKDSGSVISKQLNYSTDEQIVGTWIDGKPIYQKTVAADVHFNINGTAIADISELKIKYPISYECTIYDAVNDEYIAFPMFCTVNQYDINIFFKQNALQLCCKDAGSYNRILKVWATIKYTKTTD